MRRRDTRAAHLHDLASLAARLSDDELAVLLLIGQRVLTGQSNYGPLHIQHDHRNFTREALEKVADACFYLGAALLRRSPRRARRG